MANPVGTGPFKLKEWRRGQKIVLEANPGLSRRALSRERRARRDRELDRDDEGQAAAAGRPRRDLDHRGVESAAARVRQRRARLRQRARRPRRATCSTPDNTLKPEFAKQGVTLHRVMQPALVLHVLQHGRSRRRRLHAGQDRAAARDRHGLQHRRDDQRLVPGAGARRDAADPAGGVGPRRRLRRAARRTTRRRRRRCSTSSATWTATSDGWRELPDGKPLALSMGVDAVGPRPRARRAVEEEHDGARHPHRVRQAEVAGPAEDGRARGSCRCGRSAGSTTYGEGDAFMQLLYSSNIGQSNYSRFALRRVRRALPARPSGFPTDPSATRSTARWPSSSPRTTRGTSASTGSRTRSCGRGCSATRST